MTTLQDMNAVYADLERANDYYAFAEEVANNYDSVPMDDATAAHFDSRYLDTQAEENALRRIWNRDRYFDPEQAAAISYRYYRRYFANRVTTN